MGEVDKWLMALIFLRISYKIEAEAAMEQSVHFDLFERNRKHRLCFPG